MFYILLMAFGSLPLSVPGALLCPSCALAAASGSLAIAAGGMMFPRAVALEVGEIADGMDGALADGPGPDEGGVSNKLFAETALPAPDFKGHLLPARKDVKHRKLARKSRVEGGSLGNENQWFVDNGLKLPIIYSVEPYIPKWVPDAFDAREIAPDFMSYKGVPLLTAFDAKDAFVYIYGEVYYNAHLMVVADKNDPGRIIGLDFSAFTEARRQFVEWADVEDDILYVMHRGNGYASRFNGETGYLSAISLKDFSILWTSEPLTSNARNFVLDGNDIFCGYGFTDEKDFLYVVDKFTGRRVQSVPLRSGPDFIVLKDGRLYVETYNTYEVYDAK